MLSNPIYTGQIAHEGELYLGQQPTLIDEETWTAVRDQLAANTNDHQRKAKAAEPSLLTGREPLSPHNAGFQLVTEEICYSRGNSSASSLTCGTWKSMTSFSQFHEKPLFELGQAWFFLTPDFQTVHLLQDLPVSHQSHIRPVEGNTNNGASDLGSQNRTNTRAIGRQGGIGWTKR